MNCSEVSERLCAYADEELPPSIRQELESHVAECPRCRSDADRLVANVGFMKRTMTVLRPAGELDAGFLSDLRPRTKAEVAAAEREATGAEPGHRLRNAVIAVAVLVAAGVVYALVSSSGGPEGGSSSEKGRSADREAPETDRTDVASAGRTGRTPSPGRRTDPTGTRRPDPHNTARPVPPRRDGAGALEELPRTLARALRGADAPAAVARIVQQASVELRTAEQASTLRGLLPTAGSPEVTGFLLIVLGSGPTSDSIRPQLLMRLRSDPAAPVRAASAIALCRSGRHGRRVTYLERFPVPVADPSAETADAILEALGTESDAAVRGVLVETVAPAAASGEKASLGLAQRLATETDETVTRKILAALEGATHASLAEPLTEWLRSGHVPEDQIPAAISRLAAVDAPRAREIAAERLDAARDPGTRRALLATLGSAVSDPETLRLIGEILRSDPDASVRLAAVGLVAGGPAEVARPLLEAAASDDADEGVRRAAEAAVAGLRKPEEGRPPDDGTGETPDR